MNTEVYIVIALTQFKAFQQFFFPICCLGHIFAKYFNLQFCKHGALIILSPKSTTGVHVYGLDNTVSLGVSKSRKMLPDYSVNSLYEWSLHNHVVLLLPSSK